MRTILVLTTLLIVGLFASAILLRNRRSRQAKEARRAARQLVHSQKWDAMRRAGETDVSQPP